MAQSFERREVICADSLVWLDKFQDGGFGPETSVLTSLPDIAEMPELFRGFHVEEYKAWFVKTMSKIMSKLCVGCYMIVMQSDIRMMNNDREIFEWVDKGHLASTAADKQNMTLVWHKLVLCNKTAEKRSTGRPSYSHMLCYVKNGCRGICKSSKPNNPLGRLSCGCPMSSHRTSHFAVPDIFHRGEMLWIRGIGLDCCYAATGFLRDIAKAKRIIDPFVGVGTVLAMANALGLSAVGVELSAKRCKKARLIEITEKHLNSISPLVKRFTLDEVTEREVRKKAGEGKKRMIEELEEGDVCFEQDEELRGEEDDDEKDEIV